MIKNTETSVIFIWNYHGLLEQRAILSVKEMLFLWQGKWGQKNEPGKSKCVPRRKNNLSGSLKIHFKIQQEAKNSIRHSFLIKETFEVEKPPVRSAPMDQSSIRRTIRLEYRPQQHFPQSSNPPNIIHQEGLHRARRDTNQRRGRRNGGHCHRLPLSLPHRRLRLQLPPSLLPDPSSSLSLYLTSSPHRTVMAGGTLALLRGAGSNLSPFPTPIFLPPRGGQRRQNRGQLSAGAQTDACRRAARCVRVRRPLRGGAVPSSLGRVSLAAGAPALGPRACAAWRLDVTADDEACGGFRQPV